MSSPFWSLREKQGGSVEQIMIFMFPLSFGNDYSGVSAAAGGLNVRVF